MRKFSDILRDKAMSGCDEDLIPRQQVVDELLKEYTYWRDCEESVDAGVAIGAMGAISNVLSRIMGCNTLTRTAAPDRKRG